MRFIIEVDPEIYRKIFSIIHSGGYSDLQEFASAAFSNQLLLESQEAGSALESSTPDVIVSASAEARPPGETVSTALNAVLARNIQWEKVDPVDMPPLGESFRGYIWGQYNKFLPMKVALRQIAALSPTDGQWIELTKAHQSAAYTAAEIGQNLRQLEKSHRKGLLERLSTAFPKSFRHVKSIERFQNHFVGHITKKGMLYGMPANLGYANFKVEGSETLIGITEPGLDFCRLRNPVLDANSFDRPLSVEEADTCLEFIRSNLPKEFQAMYVVLESIAAGRDTPDDLGKRLRDLNERWSAAVLNTMRIGLLSRMWDMWLIEREKHGLRVRYSPTERGRKLLQAHRGKNREVRTHG